MASSFQQESKKSQKVNEMLTNIYSEFEKFYYDYVEDIKKFESSMQINFSEVKKNEYENQSPHTDINNIKKERHP